jgi:hypothetical protein
LTLRVSIYLTLKNAAGSWEFFPAAQDELFIDSFFELFYGINKAAFFHRYDQINGVEVYLAVKTSGQIGLILGGGMKVVT